MKKYKARVHSGHNHGYYRSCFNIGRYFFKSYQQGNEPVFFNAIVNCPNLKDGEVAVTWRGRYEPLVIGTIEDGVFYGIGALQARERYKEYISEKNAENKLLEMVADVLPNKYEEMAISYGYAA